MLFLKFRPFAGSAEFTFKDPDTGYKFEGTSITDLALKVRLYRAQNELPELVYLDTVIENYLCRLKSNVGACQSVGKLKRGLFPTIKGGIALLSNLMYNSFANQETADRRSEICLNCPHNVFPDKGPFLKWADELAGHTVGDRKSKNHDALGNCEICSCPLRGKVFYTGAFDLTDEQKDEMRKVNCWQVEDGLSSK